MGIARALVPVGSSVPLFISGAMLACGIATAFAAPFIPKALPTRGAYTRPELSTPRGTVLSLVLTRNLRVAIAISFGLVTGGFAALILLPVAAFSGAIPIAVASATLPWHFVVAAVLPHGLLELAAFSYIGACGLSGATALWSASKGSFDATRLTLRLALRLFAVGICLLTAAAIVEAFVTPIAIRLNSG